MRPLTVPARISLVIHNFALQHNHETQWLASWRWTWVKIIQLAEQISFSFSRPVFARWCNCQPQISFGTVQSGQRYRHISVCPYRTDGKLSKYRPSILSACCGFGTCCHNRNGLWFPCNRDECHLSYLLPSCPALYGRKYCTGKLNCTCTGESYCLRGISTGI